MRAAIVVACASFALAPPADAAPLSIPTSDLGGLHGGEPGARLGRRGAVADLDGDGAEDLVVLSVAPPGAWVVTDLPTDTLWWPGPEPGARALLSESYAFVELPEICATTAEVAVGDLVDTGDGAADLVLTCPGEASADGVGAAGVVRLYAGPLPEGVVTVDDATTAIQGDLANANLGGRLAVGDLNDDGRDDLVLGEPLWFDPDGTGLQRGRVTLFEGAPPAAWPAAPSVADADLTLLGTASWSRIGDRLSVGYIDAMGGTALFVAEAGQLLALIDPASCPAASGLPPSEAGACLLATLDGPFGRVWSVVGEHSISGVWIGSPTAEGSASWWQHGTDWTDPVDVDGADLRLDGRVGEDLLLGFSLAAGDLDRDGQPELLITSPGWDDDVDDLLDPIGDEAGAVYVLDGCAPAPAGARGQACGPPELSEADIADVATIRVHGQQLAEGLPGGVAFNDDGLSVLVLRGNALLLVPGLDVPEAGPDAGGLLALQLHVDADGDGSPYPDDCDDDDDDRAPSLAESCDGVDNDCDGDVPADELDADGDGERGCEGDCDDGDPGRFTGAQELSCSAVDEDCDGALHDLEVDDDGDGFTECGGDCDDTNAGTAPAEGDETVCDELDNDCDSIVDDGFDGDGDGWPGALTCVSADGSPRQLDCDDSDASVHPGAYDGVGPTDDDCDGSSGWPGGCACSTGAPPRAGWLALLLLPVVARRRRPRSHRGAATALCALAIAPLLQGQTVTSIDDEPLVAVGMAGDLPADVWAGGGLALMPDPGGPGAALLVGLPWRDAAVYNGGAVARIDADEELPLVITEARHVCDGTWSGTVLGFSIATGDFDDDGVADVAVGAPGPSAITDAAFLFGSGAAMPHPELDCADRWYFYDYPFLSLQGFMGGYRMVVTDVDGDGIDDAVVSDPAAAFTWGAVAILYGGSDFFDAEPPEPILLISALGGGRPKIGYSLDADVDWTCDGEPEITTASNGDDLTVLLNPGGGWTDHAGIDDLDRFSVTGSGADVGTNAHQLTDAAPLGDDCDDILLGLPHLDSDRGSVVLLEGATVQPETLEMPTDALVELTGSEAGDRAGTSVVPVWWTTDAATDRYPDLLIGVPGAVVPDGGYTAGLVAFVPSARVPWEGGVAEILAVATWVMQGTFPGQMVGAAMIEWTDRDGDGLDDVVVSAPGFDHPDGGDGTGALFLVRSSLFADDDGDGYPAYRDCDETHADVHPDAPELCDGLDNDCDGDVPADEQDSDGDGFSSCSAEPDCDDTSAEVHPEAVEQCNGRDDDCDGEVPADEQDPDGDQVPGCQGDCGPEDATVTPAVLDEDTCDGVDDDCDGAVDEPFDQDRDGVTTCADPPDCDDHAPNRLPGASEITGDGIDQDCDGEDPPEPPWGCSCTASGLRGTSPAWMFLGVALFIARRRR